MNIHIELKDGQIIDQDIQHFTAHDALRVIMLHNSNGTVDIYNVDEIKKFTVPIQAIRSYETRAN